MRVMAGTQRQPVRCDQLQGTIGESVSCAVYWRRPSPCRDLGASYEHGQVSEQCDRARAHYGLPPLTADDWSHVRAASKVES